MFAFPTQKSNPTPYFAHFLKEILRNRAHSREGNIKGNSLGGVISIAPKVENRQKSYHNKECTVLATRTIDSTHLKQYARSLRILRLPTAYGQKVIFASTQELAVLSTAYR